MFVSRTRLELPSEQRSETFTGVVFADRVIPASSGVVVNNVFFTPGARTHWHAHEIGQLLQVLAGAGAVVSRDGTIEIIRPGDSVWIPADEEHWHGATSESYMLHTAVSVGKTDWLAEVTEEEYAILKDAA